MRLRLDSEHRCVDALTARASRSLLDDAPAGTTPRPRQTKNGTVEPSRIPLVAHERYGGRRYEFSCGPR
jgi:hypothetical protein